jgi:hypothetical protein
MSAAREPPLPPKPPNHRAPQSHPGDDALSPWDSVPERIGRQWPGFVRSADRSARLIARTQAVEDTRAKLAAGSDPDQPELSTLAAELTARREAWRSHLGLHPAPPVPAARDATLDGEHEDSEREEDNPVLDHLRHAPSNFAGGFLWGGGIGAVLLILAGAFWLALIVAAIGGAALAMRPRLRRRLTRTLQEDRCPKCGYELSGSSAPFEMERRAGVRIGPPVVWKCPLSRCRKTITQRGSLWSANPSRRRPSRSHQQWMRFFDKLSRRTPDALRIYSRPRRLICHF